jgi:hypothetical protein
MSEVYLDDTQPIPRPPGVPEWAEHGTWFCGGCGWDEPGWEHEDRECPDCVDAGGFPEAMNFQYDDEDWL